MTALLQDLKFAARVLAKDPLFTLVAAVILALGIGVNTAVFSSVNGLLLRPLPAKDPVSIVALYSVHGHERRPESFSYPEYLDYSQSPVLQGVLAQSGLPLSFSAGERADLIWGEMVTSNYFQVLGVEATIGRTFVEADDHGPGSMPVVVLSDAFWRSHLGSDPGIAGRSVRINGHPFTVVGVAPPGFTDTRLFAFLPDCWVPLPMHAQVLPGSGDWFRTNRGIRSLNLLARLSPSVTPGEAQAALSASCQRLERQFAPGEERDILLIEGPPPFADPGFVPRERLVHGAELGLFGVSLVLAVACANVASLLLARSTSRRREMAVRSALGASRWRLLRLLLAEALLLSSLGGGLGLLFAAWVTRYQTTLVPPSPFRLGFDAGIDFRVLLFTLVASLAATLLSGLAPAFDGARTNLVSALKEDPTASPRRRRFEARGALVVLELALSLVLLVSGGLFLESLAGAREMPLGFATENGLMLSVNPGLEGYSEEAARGLYSRLLDRVRVLPGVTSASLAYPLPLDFSTVTSELAIEGREVPPEERTVSVLTSAVEAGYFDTMRTEIVKGRAFTDADREGSPRVAIVNETMARRYWPKGEAVGGRLLFPQATAPVEVVGVARDGKYKFLGEEPQPYLFLPLAQDPQAQVTLVVRTTADPAGVAAALRREIAALDPDLASFGVLTFEEFKRRSLSSAESGALFANSFSIVALALAAVGVYGVIAHGVRRRTREIGVRMALGARRSSVILLVLEGALRLALAGLTLGLLLAWCTEHALRSLLYSAKGDGLDVFALAPFVLLVVTLAAALLPALRATRIDPNRALRYD